MPSYFAGAHANQFLRTEKKSEAYLVMNFDLQEEALQPDYSLSIISWARKGGDAFSSPDNIYYLIQPMPISWGHTEVTLRWCDTLQQMCDIRMQQICLKVDPMTLCTQPG